MSALARLPTEAGSGPEAARSSPAVSSFRYSVVRTIGFLVVTILMTAASAAVARLFKRGPILEISPQGLRDKRIAPELIGWEQVTFLKVIKADRQRYVAFKLRPVHMAQLSIPLWRRAAAQFSGPRKWDGLTIAASGLDGSIDDIILAINEALVAGGYAEA